MISVAPLTEIRLGHQAYHVAIAVSGHVAAISRKGGGSILAPYGSSCTAFKVSSEVSDLAISADGSLVAATAHGRSALISTSTLRPIHRLDESIESCYFGAGGEIWSAARCDEDSIALEIREQGSWEVLARAEIPDPFGDSSFKILAHPDPEYVAVWAAAGQNGQCIFWARRSDSNIHVTRFAELDATTMPSFNRSGDEFLVVADGRELRQYRFPDGPLLGRMPWPLDDINNQIGDSVLFVKARRALLPSTADRLYLVDLSRMTIADEICIRGHEPRPCSELYPKLHETELCSDVAHISLLPSGQILSVHKQTPFLTSGEPSDNLAIWDLP